jgi:hypothetical protein
MENGPVDAYISYYQLVELNRIGGLNLLERPQGTDKDLVDKLIAAYKFGWRQREQLTVRSGR